MPRKSLKDIPTYKLEKVLDKWFSYFIRLRDSDNEGFIICCTCGRRKWWKESDNGHYSKRDKAHRFNEKNCNAQCTYCNDKMKGQADKHAIHIDSLYGAGTSDYLRATENKPKKLMRHDYLYLIDYYKGKAKSEAKKRGLRIEDPIPITY